MTPPLPKLTLGYVRVSTNKQDLSQAVQGEKIGLMSQLRGIRVDEVIVDAAESAKNLNREGVQRLLEMVRAGQVETVIIAKLDRLTRSVRDLAMLVELFNDKGVALVSVAETLDTGTAAGRMVMNIMASVSQWERETIGERTSDALQEKRRQGKRAGTVPYGYVADSEGNLVEDPQERAVISLVRDRHQQGQSLRKIAEELNYLQWTTRSGQAWRFQYVASLLDPKRS